MVSEAVRDVRLRGEDKRDGFVLVRTVREGMLRRYC